MKNTLLKHGMNVKAMRDAHGLVKGRRYAVETLSNASLAVQGDNGPVPLVDGLGTCLDASLDVAVARDHGDALPRGINRLDVAGTLTIQDLENALIFAANKGTTD